MPCTDVAENAKIYIVLSYIVSLVLDGVFMASGFLVRQDTAASIDLAPSWLSMIYVHVWIKELMVYGISIGHVGLNDFPVHNTYLPASYKRRMCQPQLILEL